MGAGRSGGVRKAGWGQEGRLGCEIDEVAKVVGVGVTEGERRKVPLAFDESQD